MTKKQGEDIFICFSEHCSKERNQIMEILDEDVPHRSGEKTRIKKGERSFERKKKIPLQY